jgi:hypothetical protein
LKGIIRKFYPPYLDKEPVIATDGPSPNAFRMASPPDSGLCETKVAGSQNDSIDAARNDAEENYSCLKNFGCKSLA